LLLNVLTKSTVVPVPAEITTKGGLDKVRHPSTANSLSTPTPSND